VHLSLNGIKSFQGASLDEIINGSRKGNAMAQKALIKMFLGYCKSICLRYAANVQEAEEIVNDGFLKVFNNIDRYDPSKPFKAWLRSIFTNTAIDHYRKNLKYTLHVNDLDENLQDLNETILSRISAKEILLLVQQLPTSFRLVFTLYVLDGYTHKEVADLLNIKEGTSKSNLQDARKKLQLMIMKNYPEVYQSFDSKNSKTT
jgi:RNA polymerase sigma-70 factor (ECF subfamily)